MSNSAVHITVEPVDELRRTFTLDRDVAPAAAQTFTAPEAAAAVPTAAAVLSVPGVREVVTAGRSVTVVQDGSCGWDTLEPQVRYALEQAAPGSAEPPRATAPADDDTLYDVVEELFSAQINPAVAQHGGRVELLDVQDGVVVVRMMGGCQGCGMATVTLRQGIEGTLRRELPGVQGVKDITDHAAGTNPYFSASKK
jgi:Fe-S cluster biogenesis protein NfuA